MDKTEPVQITKYASGWLNTPTLPGQMFKSQKELVKAVKLAELERSKYDGKYIGTDIEIAIQTVIDMLDKNHPAIAPLMQELENIKIERRNKLAKQDQEWKERVNNPQHPHNTEFYWRSDANIREKLDQEWKNRKNKTASDE